MIGSTKNARTPVEAVGSDSANSSGTTTIATTPSPWRRIEAGIAMPRRRRTAGAVSSARNWPIVRIGSRRGAAGAA